MGFIPRRHGRDRFRGVSSPRRRALLSYAEASAVEESVWSTVSDRNECPLFSRVPALDRQGDF